MKKIIFSLFMLICVFAGSLFSQTKIKPTFLSIKNDYEFTLPQLDISILLPGNTEFMVPEMSGKNIQLDIDDITCYYFDLNYLKNPHSFPFYFKLPTTGPRKEYMAMIIFEMNEQQIEQRLSESLSGSQFKRISGIKSKLGRTTSYRVKNGHGKPTECHVISKGEYYFVFILNSDMDKKTKKQYKKIIKKTYEKKQPYLKSRYEVKVKSGDFELKEEPKIPELTYKEEHKGILSVPVFFDWPAYGYGVQLPAGWEYKTEGKVIATSHHWKIFNETLTKDKFMTMSWFVSDGLTLIFRDYHDMDVESIIIQQGKMTQYSQKLDLLVDEKNYTGYFYGSEEFGSLDFYFKSKGTKHWVSFSGVTKNTLPLLQEVLSTMKIIDEENRETNTVVPDLSEQLILKESSPIELDEPLDISQTWPEDDEWFDCRLTDINFTIKLPGKESGYIATIGDKKKKIIDGMLPGIPENETDKRLMVYSLTGKPVSLAVSKKLQIIPHEEYVKNIKRGWAIYEDAECIHGSVARINGIDWCICVCRNGIHYFSMLIFYMGEHEIMVSTQTKSKEEALKSIAFLKNVSLND